MGSPHKVWPVGSEHAVHLDRVECSKIIAPYIHVWQLIWTREELNKHLIGHHHQDMISINSWPMNNHIVFFYVWAYSLACDELMRRVLLQNWLLTRTIALTSSSICSSPLCHGSKVHMEQCHTAEPWMFLHFFFAIVRNLNNNLTDQSLVICDTFLRVYPRSLTERELIIPSGFFLPLSPPISTMWWCFICFSRD